VNTFVEIAREEVAVRHLATSAQPPRATPVFSQNISFSHTPQPTRSFLLGDTPGALLKGLRCFPAASPLPQRFEGYGNPAASPKIDADGKENALEATPTLSAERKVVTCKT
jgi:hypothetical protein